jgi:hypothetical protein
MRDHSVVHRVRLGRDQTIGTIPMSVELKSIKAKVTDPQKVEKILDSYYEQGVEIELSEGPDGWNLAMTFRDHVFDSWSWPQALHWERLPSEEQSPDEDQWDDELDKRYDEEGDEGFLSLLRELAPHLETPLVILWAGQHWDAGSAKAWIVQPGARAVETLDVHP